MTTKANILLQNYVDAVWEYRLERDSGNDPAAEEEKMDAAELELMTYINSLEKYKRNVKQSIIKHNQSKHLTKKQQVRIWMAEYGGEKAFKRRYKKSRGPAPEGSDQITNEMIAEKFNTKPNTVSKYLNEVLFR